MHWKYKQNPYQETYIWSCDKTGLWANSADKSSPHFSYFLQKTVFDISCKLSFQVTICLKCIALFLWENKYVSKCRLLKLLSSILSVKQRHRARARAGPPFLAEHRISHIFFSFDHYFHVSWKCQRTDFVVAIIDSEYLFNIYSRRFVLPMVRKKKEKENGQSFRANHSKCKNKYQLWDAMGRGTK